MRKQLTEAEVDFLDHSNRIEGVYDGDSLAQAIEAWEFLKKQKKMSVGIILKTHKILMLNQNLLPSDKGYFRNIMVYVGNKPCLNALLIKEEVKQWVLNANDLAQEGKRESEIWKERMPKEHHIKFEKIHPFVDGNGRLGRMLMNWERLKLDLPVLVIKEEDRQEYYKWFKKMKRSKYWNTMVDILDGQFPKKKCKERGRALVMLAYIEMMLLGIPFGEDGLPIDYGHSVVDLLHKK